jgi:AraC-like DNA-binding protein
VTATTTGRGPGLDLLPHLRRVRDHLDRHYAAPLDLDQLAAVAAVSKFHLVRCFRATYGETPMRYLTRRRVERAQDLLRVANLTVTEVCMMVGFASLGSFSTTFTRLVGEGPAAYRDRWAARGGAHVPGCYLFMRGILDPAGTRAGPPGTSSPTDPSGAPGDPPAPAPHNSGEAPVSWAHVASTA